MKKEKQYSKIQRNTVLTYDIVILTKMKMIQTSEAYLPGSFCWEEINAENAEHPLQAPRVSKASALRPELL